MNSRLSTSLVVAVSDPAVPRRISGSHAKTGLSRATNPPGHGKSRIPLARRAGQQNTLEAFHAVPV